MTELTGATSLNDGSAWLAELGSLGRYDTYHLPGYQRHTTPSGYETVLLSFESRGIRAVLPLTVRPLPEAVRRATGYACDLTSLYGYPGPLRNVTDVVSFDPVPVDESWRSEFLAWLGKACGELSALTAFVRTNPLLDASDMFDGEPFMRGAPTPTVAVDLALPRDERLRQAGSHHRRALRKAEAHGLTFSPDRGDAAVSAFTACYLETMAKRTAGTSYLLDEERVAALLDGLGEHAELWVARKPGGEVASAAIFLRTCGIVQYHLGGTRENDYALGAARPLFEAVAEDGHLRGDRWLHLGGGVGGDGDSLLRYKAGFGPERFGYRTIRAVFDPAAYDAAARAVGADPGGAFFPAYRTTGTGV